MGWHSTGKEDMGLVQEEFYHSPRKSIRTASRELQLPTTALHSVLHKCFNTKCSLCRLWIQRIGQTAKLLTRTSLGIWKMLVFSSVVFSNEATFYVSGMLNQQNVWIWVPENPFEVHTMEYSNEKVNEWCGLMQDCVIGPFFFTKKNVN